MLSTFSSSSMTRIFPFPVRGMDERIPVGPRALWIYRNLCEHFPLRGSSREDAKPRRFLGFVLLFFASSRLRVSSDFGNRADSCFQRQLLARVLTLCSHPAHAHCTEGAKKSNCRMSPATPHPVPLPAGEGRGAGLRQAPTPPLLTTPALCRPQIPPDPPPPTYICPPSPPLPSPPAS